MEHGHKDNYENEFEEKLEKLHEEIREEQQDIRDLKKELRDEEGDLDKLEEDVEKLKDEYEDHHHHNEDQGHHGDHDDHCGDLKELKLIFIVNGNPYPKTILPNKVLQSVVEEVLKESGNTARPISEWKVKYKDKNLDITKTVKELDLPNCAELFLSLNAGTGGQF